MGRQGENLACTIVFPQTAAWKNIYGEGAVMLWHQRAAEDTRYPCAVTVTEEGYLQWPITRTETEFATEPMSRGRVEVQYIVGDVVVKSEIYETTVAEALGGDETEAPEVGAGWMESIGQVAATAEASAKRAEEAAQRAEDAAKRAENAGGGTGGSVDVPKKISDLEDDTDVSPVKRAQADADGNNIAATYAKKMDCNAALGDIETALDSIIAIQNSLIGGNA